MNKIEFKVFQTRDGYEWAVEIEKNGEPLVARSSRCSFETAWQAYEQGKAYLDGCFDIFNIKR